MDDGPGGGPRIICASTWFLHFRSVDRAPSTSELNVLVSVVRIKTAKKKNRRVSRSPRAISGNKTVVASQSVKARLLQHWSVAAVSRRSLLTMFLKSPRDLSTSLHDSKSRCSAHSKYINNRLETHAK